MSFLIQSRRTMGRVFVNFASHSCGLGIGYSRACLHLLGIVEFRNIRLNNSSKRISMTSGKCLMISYEMLEGPHAFLLGSDEIVDVSSSIVILVDSVAVCVSVIFSLG